MQEVAVTGKPTTIGLNWQYLLQALRFGLNKLEIEDDLSPVVLADSSGAKTKIIMPVNLDDGTVTGQVPARVITSNPRGPANTAFRGSNLRTSS